MRNLAPSLAIMTIPAVLMTLFRPHLSDTDSYIYMNWNLFLGLVPLAFAWLFYKGIGGKTLGLLWFLLWLGFLPNAPYMITDFIHMADVGPKRYLWYDAIMLFGFAWSGMLAWIHSLNMVYEKVRVRNFIPFITLLTAIGLYLGRYVRFNTWYVLTKPGQVITRIGEILTEPLNNPPFLLFVMVFWIFLMTVYLGYRHMHKLQGE
jgi:uncharacterized membrane protein